MAISLQVQRKLYGGLILFVGLLAALVLAVTQQPAGAQNDFSRSAEVELGNFWNPDGVIYGYLGDFSFQQSTRAAVTYHESTLGEDVAIVHRFSGGWARNFNGDFPGHLDVLKQTADGDTRPMYSTAIPTLAHMNALLADDPQEIELVRQWANDYSASDIGPMFVRLAHEADRPDRPWFGDAELFTDWWKKFVTVVEQDAPGYDAPTELVWVWSPTEFRFDQDASGNTVDDVTESYGNDLYPGPDYVDWIGASGYDFPCAVEGRPNLHTDTHEEVLEHAALWASLVAPEKPFMLAEWGAEIEERGNGGSRADFFDSTRDMLGSPEPGFDQIGAIVYFDRDHGTDSCNWSFHDRVTFPEPGLSFDEGANAQVDVGDDADFFAYRNLINTPGLIVPLGPLDTPNDALLCGGQPATIVGTADADILVGTPGFDVIVGLGGNDVIEGGEGADLICAGDGDDLVKGERGHDTIYGGAGNDRLKGGRGDDTIAGGSGDDTILGEKHEDELEGGEGNDTINGAGGDDLISGGLGDDKLVGKKGEDTISGGAGDDDINGNGSNDILNGETGTDTLFGGNGSGDECYNSETHATCETVSSRAPTCRAFPEGDGSVILSWDPVPGVELFHVRVLGGGFVADADLGASSWIGGDSNVAYEVRHRVNNVVVDIPCTP